MGSVSEVHDTCISARLGSTTAELLQICNLFLTCAGISVSIKSSACWTCGNNANLMGKLALTAEQSMQESDDQPQCEHWEQGSKIPMQSLGAYTAIVGCRIALTYTLQLAFPCLFWKRCCCALQSVLYTMQSSTMSDIYVLMTHDGEQQHPGTHQYTRP